MDPIREHELHLTRRALLGRTAAGIGTAALASLLARDAHASPSNARGALAAPHFPPTAKRVIYLFMSGAPSQLDLWDWKPKLAALHDTELPPSIRNGQRITTMTSGQARFPVAATPYKFARAGQSGAWISELLPKTAEIVDDLAIVRTLCTDAINHDPGITFVNTGHEQPGRPSAGSWASYGLGSENADLPAFVVLHSSWTGRQEDQALFNRLWGSGFLPSVHQGVALRSKGDPVLYLSNPPGVDPSLRRRMLDGLAKLNEEQHAREQDPETLTRIAQYEMAFRMQTSVPDLLDVSKEPASVLELYGPEVHTPGTFARNCLLARRLAERDVRFVQVYIRGWDQHNQLQKDLPNQARDIDHACAGLVRDLKQRGMLDDTLVVWCGEFGRTVYSQGDLAAKDWGRDHHPRCFTGWLAGGGAARGVNYGVTDDFSYNVVENPVHVHDWNATILRCLGVDHERLTYRFQGRDFRLTDVHGKVVRGLLA